MAQRLAKSCKEYAGVLSLAFVAWCLSRVAHVFRDIFESFGVALPLPTRIVLAASPVYPFVFAGAVAAFVFLLIESLGWDGGRAERLRGKTFAVLERIAGRRAALLQNLLIAGTMIAAAAFFVCAVCVVFRPMIVMRNMPEGSSARPKPPR